jgi:23S rRNA (cytidine1920-2'-O)/16S rRNA (cytidine1409-2'-O)-methyltransferase
MKKRVDVLLAVFGLCRSRSEAKDLVGRGLVEVGDLVVDKVSREFEEEGFGELVKSRKVKILTEQYVGRGAYKLVHALKSFNLSVTGKICLDIGSSTGGFTQVLLQNGADKVHAIDVGSEQFDKKLFEQYRSKINLHEQTDIRNFKLAEKVDLVVCDVSFISVKEVIKVLHKFLKSDGHAVLLVKPQFEVGKGELGKGGIVKDKKLQQKVLEEVKDFALASGFRVLGETESVIEGGDGNIEYLLFLKRESNIFV